MFSGWYNRQARLSTWNDKRVFDRCTAQYPWEIEVLADIVGKQKPKVIVEIGSQNGGTLVYWLKVASPECKIIAIDPEPQFSFDDSRLTVYATRSDDPGTIEAVKALGGIDFLFIDGDHGYEGARYDFDTYGPMVSRGGVIAFHDIMTVRSDCQVRFLWREIQKAGYPTRELLVSEKCQPTGAGIGVVYV